MCKTIVEPENETLVHCVICNREKHRNMLGKDVGRVVDINTTYNDLKSFKFTSEALTASANLFTDIEDAEKIIRRVSVSG